MEPAVTFHEALSTSERCGIARAHLNHIAQYARMAVDKPSQLYTIEDFMRHIAESAERGYSESEPK